MKLKMTAIAALALMIVTAAAQTHPGTESDTHRGKVISTMDSGSYTYIQFEEKGKKLWAASKQLEVSVGDTIEFSRAITMKDFYSRTLNRTFDWIFFVGYINVKNKNKNKNKNERAPGSVQAAAEKVTLPAGHVPIGLKTKTQIIVKPGSVKKADDGYTVAECYSLKDSLKGKQVKVRGRVVKFAANILGKNWLHLRDGTGGKGSNDLTVTTKQEAKTGDLILVTGKITYNKNFGAGYVYPVIIEDASVIVE